MLLKKRISQIVPQNWGRESNCRIILLRKKEKKPKGTKKAVSISDGV